MTTSVQALPLPDATAVPLKRKRVLLVDSSSSKRELRAETMRKLGMEVDVAADIGEARSWWRADLYNLVLISSLGDEPAYRDKFCQDVRGATPPQQLAFLVGKPSYLADAPSDDLVPSQPHGNHEISGDVQTALAATLPGGISQRWGILEASRRISAVRSLSHARTKASQNKPLPPHDLEVRAPKRSAETRSLDELLREEMR
jgi:hypothetical protein